MHLPWAQAPLLHLPTRRRMGGALVASLLLPPACRGLRVSYSNCSSLSERASPGSPGPVWQSDSISKLTTLQDKNVPNNIWDDSVPGTAAVCTSRTLGQAVRGAGCRSCQDVKVVDWAHAPTMGQFGRRGPGSRDGTQGSHLSKSRLSFVTTMFLLLSVADVMTAAAESVDCTAWCHNSTLAGLLAAEIPTCLVELNKSMVCAWSVRYGLFSAQGQDNPPPPTLPRSLFSSAIDSPPSRSQEPSTMSHQCGRAYRAEFDRGACGDVGADMGDMWHRDFVISAYLGSKQTQGCFRDLWGSAMGILPRPHAAP